MEIVESILILAAHGIRQELHTLFRIFLDAYFLVANVSIDSEFISLYFSTDEAERLKLLNVASRQDHELFKTIKEYATDQLRADLADKVRDERIQALNSQ